MTTASGATTDYYANWRNVPEKRWRWPNFSPEEIACRGDGRLRINEPALDALQALRDRLGVPLIVNSAYRTPNYNRQVGGAKHSMHLQGAAFDISMANHDPVDFEAAARDVGFTGFGFYARQNFMHIDIGRARQWGDPHGGCPHRPAAARAGTRRRAGDDRHHLRLWLCDRSRPNRS